VRDEIYGTFNKSVLCNIGLSYASIHLNHPNQSSFSSHSGSH